MPKAIAGLVLSAVLIQATACTKGPQLSPLVLTTDRMRSAPVPGVARSPSPWWSVVVQPGPFPLGFRVLGVTDSSRLLANGHPRRIQISLWYPCYAAGQRSLTYGAYLALVSSEVATSTDSVAQVQRDRSTMVTFLTTRGAAKRDVDRWFDAPMLAEWAAPPAVSSYPLVLIAQGNGESAHDQAVLAEYLASAGYVVATSPSQTRLSGSITSDSEIARSIAEQADDLTSILRLVATLPGVDTSHIGVVGHSFGARSAVLMALHRPTIRAVVSLDGGIGTATADSGINSALSSSVAVRMAGVLHFDEQLDRFMAPEDTFLRELAGRTSVWVAHTTEMHHHHFTVLGAVPAAFPGLASALHATPTTPLAYAAVLRATKAFLAAFLSGTLSAFPPPAAEAAPGPDGRITTPLLRFERL